MIEGLKATVNGAELTALCAARAEHHEDRAKVYAEQAQNLKAASVEGMAYTNGDPVKALTDRLAEHSNEAAELRFLAEHLDPTESYLLARADLHKLGLTKTAY